MTKFIQAYSGLLTTMSNLAYSVFCNELTGSHD
jgi:hypothetical protein